MENETEPKTAEVARVSESLVPKEKGVTREAMLVASAILLGSFIIAGAVLTLSSKSMTPTQALPSENQAAVPAQEAAPKAVTLDQIKSLFTDQNLAFGNKESKVLFVEFSDPSCPYCHVAGGKNPTIYKLMGSSGERFKLVADGGSYVAPVTEMKKLVDAGKAGFVWLYANGHGNGELATEALYCAKEKGKFWEAHDLLMNAAGYTLVNETVKNDRTKSSVMADFLKSATNASAMKECLESGRYTPRISQDMALAQQMGFSGTPNFFVNTENFVGAQSYKDMQATVEKYLK
jgi:protein-disulfide isomerase